MTSLRSRLAARRLVWPAVAVAAMAAVAALAVTTWRGDPTVPTTVPATVASTDPGPGIWPFASAADAAAYPAGGPYRDPDSTARAFATTYLGITDQLFTTTVTNGDQATSRLRVPIGEGGRPWPDAPPVSVLYLNQVGSGGPWTVVSARAPRIEPGYALDHGLVASSPVRLQGRANAYEGTVQVEIRQDGMVAGQSLGEGFVTGSGDSDGSLGPFDGEVAFRPPTRAGGAVLLYEASAATGGGLLQVTVVRVTFDRS